MAISIADKTNSPWESRLRGCGLRLAGTEVELEPGAAPGVSSRYLTPLLHRGWLAMRGPDALGFMHEQFSAELRDLPPERWQAAAYCNPQGRVLALLRVIFGPDSGYAELPAGLLQPTVDRLQRFVLRSRVDITPLAGHSALGCWGSGVEQWFTEAGLPVPEPAMGHQCHDDVHLLTLPGTVPRYIVQGPDEALLALWDKWIPLARPVDTDAWRLQEIQAGWPDIQPETCNRFLPQSLNLEAWGGLSYTKGCYPGQEIIARTHYRGRLKQHLYRATVAARPPAAGAQVVDTRGNNAGWILYAARSAPGQSFLLAVLREYADEVYRLETQPERRLVDLKRL